MGGFQFFRPSTGDSPGAEKPYARSRAHQCRGWSRCAGAAFWRGARDGRVGGAGRAAEVAGDTLRDRTGDSFSGAGG
ncbi:hypothetical protein D3C81_1818980 [compost metagenome]